MPTKTAEQLKEKAEILRKKLAEKGPSMDPVAVRRIKKRIRRAQRRARKLVARVQKKAGKAASSD